MEHGFAKPSISSVKINDNRSSEYDVAAPQHTSTCTRRPLCVVVGKIDQGSTRWCRSVSFRVKDAGRSLRRKKVNRNEPIHIVYVRTEKCTGAVIRYRPSNAYLCLRVLLKTTPQRRATQLIITSLSWWSLCKRKPCSHMFDGGMGWWAGCR